MYASVHATASYDDIDFAGQGDDVEWPPRTVVVYFSADDNVACDQFWPHFALAASLVEEDGLAPVFHRVDVTGTKEEHKAPFVQMFRHNLHLEYTDTADGYSLASWVKQKGGVTIHRIQDPEEFRKLQEDSQTLLVVYEVGGGRSLLYTNPQPPQPTHPPPPPPHPPSTPL